MKFTLEITLGNEAMVTGYDIAVALDTAAKQVNSNASFDRITKGRKVLDHNGNTVGFWKIEE